MRPAAKLAALVLAAGCSSRAPGFKPLLPLGEATVIETTLASLCRAGIGDITAVVGHRAADLLSVLAGLPVLLPALAFLAVWYGAEWLLSVKAGWHVSRWSIASYMLRDLMLPVLYVNAWLGRGFEWRGNDMRAAEGARLS